MRVKIFGAGSIGNHLASGCRDMGWQTIVVDKDNDALFRMKNEIYPKRYGAWDEDIKLFALGESPKGGFDVIFVGTPPDAHLKVATQVLREEAPRVLQIEKPLCSPTLEGLPDFLEQVELHPETMVVVGYNHLLAVNTLKIENILRHIKNLCFKGIPNEVKFIGCEFRSHWENIFKAHPWLNGPQDTYLGHWNRGGGASGEHSHGLNLWQHLAHVVGAGRIKYVNAVFDFIEENGANYDRLCSFNLKTENGISGVLTQDVITLPKVKKAWVSFKTGYTEWRNDVTPETDEVLFHILPEKKEEPHVIHKTRRDEFLREIEHIKNLIENKIPFADSPIRLERALDTMFVLRAAYWSHEIGDTVTVDYNL